MHEYSEKEFALISFFFPSFIKDKIYELITAPVLYRMMVEECFMRFPTENNVFKQSLWNCYNAFNKTNIDGSKIYRMTPEWDRLILNSVLGKECHCDLSNETNFVTHQTCCEVCDAFVILS